MEKKEPSRQAFQEAGFGLIAMIGLLALLSVGLAVISPSLIRIWDRHDQELEDRQLELIEKGMITYLRQNKTFPPSLASLVPDYVPFPTAQLTTNPRGFPRYYAIHPGMTGFNNRTGLSAAELVNARFLLLSNLTQDAAPTITTPAEFETWWTTDESLVPDLHVHRSNIGDLFYSLVITPEGNGASFFISAAPSTDSGGGLLPTHNAFHLAGTLIGFDEAATYTSPEVQFGLTTNTAYWFNPLCSSAKQWNPLDPSCGSLGTVKDEFNAVAYSGNDGTQNWGNDWQETGEADGPTNGKMQVVADAHCVAGNCFQFGGGGGGPSTEVRREVNLSGAASATLTFSYRRSAGANGGSIQVEASNNGGASWTTLQTYTMNGSDLSQVPQTFDLTPYIASNAQVRFVRTGNVKRLYYADNIEITWN